MALSKTSIAGLFSFFSALSSAPYTIFIAIAFLPEYIILFMNLATKRLEYFVSGSTSVLCFTGLRMGYILIFKYLNLEINLLSKSISPSWLRILICSAYDPQLRKNPKHLLRCDIGHPANLLLFHPLKQLQSVPEGYGQFPVYRR